MTFETFPSVALLDALGTRIVLAEDQQQEGCAILSIAPKHGGEPEIILNRSTVVLLREALGLWLQYLQDEYALGEYDPDADADE